MEWALETCCQLSCGNQQDSGRVSAPNMQWGMLEEGTLKINVDGGVFLKSLARVQQGRFYEATAEISLRHRLDGWNHWGLTFWQKQKHFGMAYSSYQKVSGSASM